MKNNWNNSDSLHNIDIWGRMAPNWNNSTQPLTNVNNLKQSATNSKFLNNLNNLNNLRRCWKQSDTTSNDLCNWKQPEKTGQPNTIHTIQETQKNLKQSRQPKTT